MYYCFTEFSTIFTTDFIPHMVSFTLFLFVVTILRPSAEFQSNLYGQPPRSLLNMTTTKLAYPFLLTKELSYFKIMYISFYSTKFGVTENNIKVICNAIKLCLFYINVHVLKLQLSNY